MDKSNICKPFFKKTPYFFGIRASFRRLQQKKTAVFSEFIYKKKRPA